MKILICDDDEGILEILRIMLEGDGHTVMALYSGKGIVKKAQYFKPQMIFLDLWMSGMDGKEAAKLLKKDPRTKDIPLIILSAIQEIDVISKEIGADGFLAKPFDMEDLYALVNKYAV